jgi:hypothetical protein
MFRVARRLTIVRTEVVFVSHEVEQCAEIGRVGGHQPKEQREQAGDRQLIKSHFPKSNSDDIGT